MVGIKKTCAQVKLIIAKLNADKTKDKETPSWNKRTCSLGMF